MKMCMTSRGREEEWVSGHRWSLISAARLVGPGHGVPCFLVIAYFYDTIDNEQAIATKYNTVRELAQR